MTGSISPSLHVIVDDSPVELLDQLDHAASIHNISCEVMDAHAFNALEYDCLPPRALLYRVGITHASCVMEQALYRPDVATFYGHPYGPFGLIDTPSLLMERAGVPVPAAVHVLAASRERLRAQVEQLGGFPVVIKIPGHSLGMGVVRVADWASLFSIVDLVQTVYGNQATLMRCVEPAVHWRVIVVGTHVVSAYINPQSADDFRTHVDESSRENFLTRAPQAVQEAALLAVASLQLECGGVDVLCDEQGDAYVLEVNFPFYFAHPMRAVGVDVASAMVAYLLAKSAELS